MECLTLVFCLFLIAFPLTANSFEMPAEPVVVMETNQGEIHLRLYPEIAPKTVENFLRLTESGYYNNTQFHRIIQDFMIQGGDPTGTGRGGQSIWGRKFEDEVDSGLEYDRPGLLGMANAGPNTNGSQFFITTVPTPWLNDHHTLFGEVVRGMEIVRLIEAAGSPRGTPKESQVIRKMYVKLQK